MVSAVPKAPASEIVTSEFAGDVVSLEQAASDKAAIEIKAILRILPPLSGPSSRIGRQASPLR
jgi:hypothetical protein